MNRIKGLALGLGLAALMVVGLACGAGETQDPAEAGPASGSPQAQGQPRPSGSAGEITSPVISGSPLAPLVSLTYEGAVYYQTGTRLVNLDEDDFELVGATPESNLIAPGSGESLKIYVMKGEAGNVYTLSSGRSVQIEDCVGALEAAQCTITMKALEDYWLRWTPDSN